MTKELAFLLAQLALKYGPEAALAIAKIFKTGATIDDAITALQESAQMAAAQFIKEAQARKEAADAIAAQNFSPLPPSP